MNYESNSNAVSEFIFCFVLGFTFYLCFCGENPPDEPKKTIPHTTEEFCP